MEKSPLSLRLIALRKASDMTQEDVAVKLGMNRSTYTCYEIGTSTPSVATLCTLAELFNVSVDYLIGRTAVPDGECMDASLPKTEELQVLELYRRLNRHRRDMVIQIMKEF